MANEEQVKMLRRNTEAWNSWREENPDITPDFFGADLTGDILRGVDFLQDKQASRSKL